MSNLPGFGNYPRIEKPTAPGWYWFRSDRRPSIWWPYRVQFDGSEGWTKDDGEERPISEMSGHWRGPIPEPTP